MPTSTSITCLLYTSFKRAQENSVLLGQNNLFGYNKVDGRLEIVEPEAAVVREVFERYAACLLYTSRCV